MKFKGLMVAAMLWGSTAHAVEVGGILPDVSIAKHETGGALTNASLQGKVTVINFWATWCAACKVELIEMEDQLKPYLTNDEFQVAFVSLDKDPAKAAEWFQANLKNPALFMKHLYSDAQFEAADKLKVDSFPMTIVIGKDGKIEHVQRGFKEGEDSTARLVRLSSDLLKKTAH